uniref:Uncharacterized protein n=1 Tax=Sphaerodactylus townsendi TaxID=933632 RepID=A0ACB8EF81_9SAUR
MYGCQVELDGLPNGGHFQYAYEGKDFLSLDKETLTWTALTPPAQITKRKWEAEKSIAEYWKTYLEEICVEWLWRYLDYGKKTLLRTEAPAVKVARKAGYDGRETLICQAHGFYPAQIDVTWMKDGEDRKQDTLMGGVVPNSDGTYHTWRSIEVDSQERDHYQCQVAHDSLPEPLDFTWEEPASNQGLLLGVLLGVLVALILLGAMVIIYYRSDRGSDSTSVSVPPEA